jgi:predicted Zn-ribbon and HTH transcriptional regulator
VDLSFLDPIGGVRTVIIVAAVLFLAVVLRKLFARPTNVAHTAPARCTSCGWVGTVSRHAPRCPKCAARIEI